MSWVFWGGTDEADHRQFSAFKRGDTAGIISPLHVVVDGEFSRIAFESGPLGLGVDIRAVARAGLRVTLVVTLSLMFLVTIALGLISAIGR